MDSRKLQFLEAVVGRDGAQALSKAAERAVELDQAIFPRAVTAWIESIAPFGFDGYVPGVEDAQFRFAKSESGFSGIVTINGELHRFDDASVNHLAGCVAVALGLDHERVSSQAKPEQLAKLGKSIDLLVKTQLVKTSIKPATAKKRINLPGMPAQPIAPKQPLAPTPVQPANQKQTPAGAAGTAQTSPLPKPKLPKLPKQTLTVTKSEANKKCPHCARAQFKGNTFSGCFCFSALAKNVKTTGTATGFNLEFGSAWDQDAILSLAETFRGK